MGFGNSGARHVDRVNDLLEIRRRTIGRDVVSEYDERLDGRKRKAKRNIYLTKGINESPDKQSNHMTINKQSETDLRTITERSIGNQSKNDQKKINRKPMETEP